MASAPCLEFSNARRSAATSRWLNTLGRRFRCRERESLATGRDRPRMRDGQFYPFLLERYQRSEKAIVMLPAGGLHPAGERDLRGAVWGGV